MSDLGPEIPIVNGERPEWLEDGEIMATRQRDEQDDDFDDVDWYKARADTWCWGEQYGATITAIRLRADHPYYTRTANPPTPAELTRAIIKAVNAEKWSVAERLCALAGEV